MTVGGKRAVENEPLLSRGAAAPWATAYPSLTFAAARSAS